MGDFEDIKGGSFSKQFKVYQKQHPKSLLKTIDEFSENILQNPHHYKELTVKRARNFANRRKNGGAMSIIDTAYGNAPIESQKVPFNALMNNHLTIPSITFG